MEKLDSLNQVADFHKTFKHPILDEPQIPSKERSDLRVELLSEELKELQEAIENNETLSKEVILQTTKRNEAKMQEFLLQWQCRHDSLCLNDMLHIRLRLTHLKDFVPVTWKPKHSTDTFVLTEQGYQARQ